MILSYATAAISSGQAARPYSNAFTTPPPAGRLLDPNSVAIAAELPVQAKIGAPTLNWKTFSAEVTPVPEGTPRVPVTLLGGTQDWRNVAAAIGIPVPPGVAPEADTDATLILWESGYVNPHTGQLGRCHEVYKAKVLATDPTTGQPTLLQANGWNRTDGVNDMDHIDFRHVVTGPGTANPTGDPDSTFCPPAARYIQGSGIAYPSGLLTAADCARGFVDHYLGLTVVHANKVHQWPATFSDGDKATIGPLGATSSLLSEGMWIDFPPDIEIPASAHPIQQLLIQGGRDRGYVITDRSSSCLGFRATPSCDPYTLGAHGYQIMAGFPWDKLRVRAQGSPANPIPTAA